MTSIAYQEIAPLFPAQAGSARQLALAVRDSRAKRRAVQAGLGRLRLVKIPPGMPGHVPDGMLRGLGGLGTAAAPRPRRLRLVKIPPGMPGYVPGVRGLGYAPTPGGAGYEEQYRTIEERPSWAGQLPAQVLWAPTAGQPGSAFRYAFPNTASSGSFVTAQIPLPSPGYYGGEMQAGIPAPVNPLLAALYPQLNYQFQQPWQNPWSSQQYFGGTPYGVPIWGGGMAPLFQPAGPGTGGAMMPVAAPGAYGPGAYPQAGEAMEKF